jgi:hypothetical protein
MVQHAQAVLVEDSSGTNNNGLSVVQATVPNKKKRSSRAPLSKEKNNGCNSICLVSLTSAALVFFIILAILTFSTQDQAEEVKPLLPAMNNFPVLQQDGSNTNNNGMDLQGSATYEIDADLLAKIQQAKADGIGSIQIKLRIPVPTIVATMKEGKNILQIGGTKTALVDGQMMPLPSSN